jgi:hypothetical protein
VIKALDNILAVPVAAVLQYDGRDHLSVRKPDGGIEWRSVVLGTADDKSVEVKKGIQAGDQIVLNPLSLLTEDEKREKLAKPVKRASQPAKRQTSEAMRGV